MNKAQAIKFVLGLTIAIVGIIGISDHARAADVVLGTDLHPMFDGKQTGVIWTGVNTGYMFILSDGDQAAVTYKYQWTKTTNGGLTFSSPTTFLEVNVRLCAFAGDVFYDKWTPQITDTYIHLYFYTKSLSATCSASGGSSYHYYRFDVSNDTFDITDDGSGDVCFSSCSPPAISISRAANGYLYRHHLRSASAGSTLVTESSTNDGTTWSVIANPTCGMSLLFPVRPNPTFFIDSEDVTGYCTSDRNFYHYDRSANAWNSRYEYNPNYGSGTVVCSTNRVIDSSSGQYYIVTTGSIGGACFTTDGWADIVTHEVNNLGLSTTFREHNVYTGITHPSGGVSSRGIYSATEGNLYVFTMIADALDDDVVFYSSEDEGETWSDQLLFDSEEENRTVIFLAEAITASGGWIYPIWRNNTGDSYDTNLLAIFAQLPTFQFPGEHTPEEILQGFSSFLGTWLFVAIIALSIFFMHIIWRWPYELMYPFGLICGAILGHPTVAIIESWWLIAAVSLIAAIYIYRMIFQGNGETDGG